ncbi:MAG TPA: T9SS type A sorting domain-containing protein [Bacteroidia bacterium]|nr:T9SS type A sorting domain-containing protein [Bacteroidia bacterium]
MKRKQLYILSLAFLGLMGRADAQCGWLSLGTSDSNTISFGESVDESVAIDPTTNTPYIAYRDGNNFYGASVSKYVGGKWQLVGAPGFTYGKPSNSAEIYDESFTINKAGVPYLACEDKGYANHCAVFWFNGTAWDTVPGQTASFTTPVQFISLTTDTNGIPYVAYENLGTSKLDVLMYNAGTQSWMPVGGSLGISPGQAQYISMAFDRVNNIPYVAFEDGKHADKLMVYSFTSGAWAPAADTAGLTTDTVNWISMTTDKSGHPYVAYEDFSDNKKLSVMTFNGTAWSADTTNSGTKLGTGGVNYTSIGVDASNNVYVAYEDFSYYGYKGLSIAENKGSGWGYAGGSYKISQSISAYESFYVGLAIDKNGVPFVGYEDKGVGNHAYAFQFNTVANAWQMMGSTGLSNINPGTWNGLASYNAIATQPTTNTPYVAYRDGNTGGKATVMSWTGSTWAPVGTPGGVSTSSVKFTTIGFDKAGDPICMFSDKGASTSYGVVAKVYKAGAWTAIGTNSAALSGSNAYTISMAVANDTVYSAFELGNYHMSVMKCAVTGTTWVNVGSADVNGDSASYQSIAIDKNGVPYVAFCDNAANLNGISVMKFVGGTWQYVGSRNFSNGKAVYPSLQIDPTDNMPVVAYSSYGAGQEANVAKFNGTAWMPVGIAGFSNDWTSYMSLAIDAKGAFYVAYADWGNEVKNLGQENCTVEKFDPKVDTAWRFIPMNGSCSQAGSTYEACTIDGNGNLYVTWSAYSAYVNELACPTGINEINGGSNVQASVYPNPSHGSFTIALQNAPERSYVNVFNILGENIYQAKLTNDKTQINLNNQSAGIYLYRILDENGKVVSTGKLIIQ